MNRGASVFAYATLLVLSGALQRPLNGGLSVEGGLHEAVRQANWPIAMVGFGLYAVAILTLLPRLAVLPLPGTLLPLLALDLWAWVSALWSHDPALTLARAAGLSGAGIAALACLALLGPDRLLTVLARGSAAFVLVNAALALLAPDFARHGADDLYAMHAGRLRGSYGHKNEFAVYLAIAVTLLALLGERVSAHRWLRVALCAAGGAMLLATGSAKVVIAVPLAVAAASLSAALAPAARLWLLGFAAGLAALLAAVLPLDDLWRFGLEELGRDPTLSARTAIWQAALDGWRDDPLLGGGYAAAWSGGLGAAAARAIGFDPGHPHNGYLAVLFDLGAVGLMLALVNLALVAWPLLREPASSAPAAYRVLAALVVLVVVLNGSGTHLAQPNDLVSALQVWMHALAAALRSPARGPIRMSWPLTSRPDRQPVPQDAGA